MKVKEYLVSEILDLKHNIRKLQDDIARDSAMIDAQHARIESFERREEKFKTNSNKLYGDLCQVRQIISDILIPGEPDINTGKYIPISLEDYKKLLQILGLDNAERKVPDEVSED